MAKTILLIELEQEVMQALEVRARKEFLPLKELIAEILRRSVLASKLRRQGSIPQQDKEDPFIGYFSRIGGRPKKSGLRQEQNGI